MFIPYWTVAFVITVGIILITFGGYQLARRLEAKTRRNHVAQSVAILWVKDSYTRWLGEVIESKDIHNGESGISIQINYDGSVVLKTSPNLRDTNAASVLLASALELGNNGHKKEPVYQPR